MEPLMNNDLPLPGTRLGSFLVQQKQLVSELNLTAITLQHEPTGARLLHLACDDPNNVFAIGFPITVSVGLLGVLLTLPMLSTPFTFALEHMLAAFQ